MSREFQAADLNIWYGSSNLLGEFVVPLSTFFIVALESVVVCAVVSLNHFDPSGRVPTGRDGNSCCCKRGWVFVGLKFEASLVEVKKQRN